MMKIKLCLSLLFFCLTTWALGKDVCSRRQEDIQDLLAQESSRIAFKNNGGLFNKGVCWWHSRLQRSSAYLVQYDPTSPRPSTPEVWRILTHLRLMDRVVVIPGYDNFEDFSQDYQYEIQAMLNGWQKRDGFFNFVWIKSISGKSFLPPGQMLLRMKDIYRRFTGSPVPLWIMAQIRGITSHSLLVLGMSETESGYEMKVIDSNYPKETIVINYKKGDTSLQGHKNKYTFVPYAGFQKDFLKIHRALGAHCGSRGRGFSDWHIMPGDIER